MRAVFEGIAVTAIGGAALWGAFLIPAAPAGESWAGSVPMGVACGVFLIGMTMTVSALKQAVAGGRYDIPAIPKSAWDVIGLVILSLVYFQSLVMFGYVLSTALVAPIALWSFGVRNRLGLVVSAVICPLVFHVIFFELLGVFPPYGKVFGPLDLIRS